MNTNKFYDFFKPDLVEERIHILGCGAVGSTLGDTFARMGLTNVTLYDFDTVDYHNIANQLFTEDDIGKLKVDALAEHMIAINPDVKNNLRVCKEGWTNQILSGYVFLCVDNIDLRRKIVETYQYNPFIKAMFDIRMRLTDAQCYAADWSDPKAVQSLLNSMQFTHEEAQAETPVSACNLTLSIIPTVWLAVSVCAANFMKFAKGEGYKRIVYVDSFKPSIEAF